MPKVKSILWLTPQDTQGIENRIKLMKKIGYETFICTRLEECYAQIAHMRPYIILISQFPSESQTINFIEELTAHPDTKSLRFVYVTQFYQSSALNFAACNAFKAILHLNADSREWHDCLSSLENLPLSLTDTFNSSIGLGTECGLKSPGRIIHLFENTLRIETYHEIPSGQQVVLEGHLFDQFGWNQVKGKVTKLEKSKLSYRFSCALEIDISESLSNDSSTLMERIPQKNLKEPALKVFSILSQKALRKYLHQIFNNQGFDITTAFKLKNMAQELKFLSPDVITIEEKYLSGSYESSFLKLLNSTIETTLFIIIVNEKNQFLTPKALQKRKYFICEYQKLRPEAFSHEKILHYIQQNRNKLKHQVFTREDRLTYCMVCIQVQMAKINPNAFQLDSKIKLRPYALYQLTSKTFPNHLNQEYWVKIWSSYPNSSPFRKNTQAFKAEGKWLCLSQKTKQDLMLKAQESFSFELQYYFRRQTPEVRNKSSANKKNIPKKTPTIPTTKPKRNFAKIRKKSDTKAYTFSKTYKLIFAIFASLAIIYIASKWIGPILEKDLERSGQKFIDQMKLFQHQNNQ